MESEASQRSRPSGRAMRGYFSNGNLNCWVYQFSSVVFPRVNSVAMDPQGYIYIAGGVGGNLPGYNTTAVESATLAKFDLNFNLIWIRQYSSAGGGITSTDAGVVLDPSGNPYISGHVNGNFPGVAQVTAQDSYLMNSVRRAIKFG